MGDVMSVTPNKRVKQLQDQVRDMESKPSSKLQQGSGSGSVVRSSAIALLARREHTRKELVKKLAVKFPDADCLLDVVSDLQGDGLQSDERFAEQYVRMRANKGLGPVRIEQEMIEKGVSSDLRMRFIHGPDYDWSERACEVWKKKFSGRRPVDIKEKAKQQRFLLYRGYLREHFGWFLDV
jgi:regulatory protein